MLNFKRFEKGYKGHIILSLDDLTFSQGVSWLMGTNGAGKTTLLRCVAGIIDYKGQIAWNGIDMEKEPITYRLLVNFGEAEPLFPAFLKGMELIRFFSEAKKAPSGQAETLIEQFGAQHYLQDPVGTYSSGMAKKLSLILAFLGHPQLILLDEPLVTLDVEAQETLKTLIQAHAAKDVDFIISSHQVLDLVLDGPMHKWEIQQGKLHQIA